jgi:glucan-binding YG repeat protein
MSTGVTPIGSGDKIKTYFFNPNGTWVKNKAGWVKDGTDRFYFINGVAKVGWKVINGKSYTFRANGTLVK